MRQLLREDDPQYRGSECGYPQDKTLRLNGGSKTGVNLCCLFQDKVGEPACESDL